MGTLTIKSSSLNRTADYEAQGIKINLNYQIGDQNGELLNISGTIYTGENVYAGNFSGTRRNDSIDYNISGVKLSDMPAINEALNDIETQINSSNQD